ncbi:MAG: methyltransferase domain-containing protein [Pararhodobacter sp.]|nr:methyltransferase domain-containing protein [Pararhodobacter sp.]
MDNLIPAGQHWSAKHYARDAGFVPALGAPLLALIDLQAGERVLDLGCGDGVLTTRLARTGADVTGLEPDPDMARAARARGISVMEQDAHDAFGESAFDAVFSNAALHWMRKPEQVLGHVHVALRPGGRFVAEQGGFGNVAAVVTALMAALEAQGHPTPARPVWDFPSVTGQRRRLEAAGFLVDEIALIPRPTPLPTGISGWLATFANPFLTAVPQPARASVLADCTRRLSVLHDAHEGWIADYVRLRFLARKPG